MFLFKSRTPKDKLKEFNSFAWVMNNRNRIGIQSLILLLFAFLLESHVLFVWGTLPAWTFLTFLLGDAAKIGAMLQSFWYFPVLLWRARHETI